MMGEDDDDICGLCGLPGADKIPHPIYWPDERRPYTEYVHAEGEDAEREWQAAELIRICDE